MTDEVMLFKRIRDVALRLPYRSAGFIEWLKVRASGSFDFHHLFGSVHGLKSTDLLGVLRTREQHRHLELHPMENYDLIPEAIANLLAYVRELEDRARDTE